MPFSMGSLGFLTPFPPSRLREVMRDVLVGGFPIQLRHRLHCTIVRGGAADAAALSAHSGEAYAGGEPPPCCADGQEHVVLNEVVLDRGISPFLTNLEAYCEGTHVTNVQVGWGAMMGCGGGDAAGWAVLCGGGSAVL